MPKLPKSAFVKFESQVRDWAHGRLIAQPAIEPCSSIQKAVGGQDQHDNVVGRLRQLVEPVDDCGQHDGHEDRHEQ